MNKNIGPLLLCAAFFGLASTFEALSQPTGEAQGYLISAAKAGPNAAVSQAAGEFRVVAANVLWAKVVDHYHHQYMADGGDWSKNESLLPLLKTITELDPHFTQAYQLMGGTILPRTGRTAEGEKMLALGLKSNPNDWEMYREMAMLYAWTEHRPDWALPYAKAGLAQADDDFSRRMMATLCRTLEGDIRRGTPGRTTGDGHPPPTPVAGASAGRSRPSESG